MEPLLTLHTLPLTCSNLYYAIFALLTEGIGLRIAFQHLDSYNVLYIDHSINLIIRIAHDGAIH